MKSYSNSHCQSLLLTAIRETAEETGLYLAEADKSSSKPFINSESSWNDFTDKSYVPSIHKLLFLVEPLLPQS